MLLGSAGLRSIDETTIHNGRVVRPGDTVHLLPFEQRKYERLTGDELEDEKELERDRLTRNEKWLGKGPFTISWISRWPCGGVTLYLKGAMGSEPGAYASDFM